MLKRLPLLLLFILPLIVGTGLIQAQDVMPLFDWLAREEWHVLSPNGSTMCSDGSEFRFLVRPGLSNRLVIYFQGGGGCWDTNTCANLRVFDANVYDETGSYPPPEPENGAGILNMDYPPNPFSDATVVYIPYCSADFHMGSSDTSYPTTPGNAITVIHRGAHNASETLKWVFKNFNRPESIFMAGCSAGGPGAIFHAPSVHERYPDVPLTVFSDSASGYEGNLAQLFDSWGTMNILPNLPGLAGRPAGSLDFEAFFIAFGQAYPEVKLAGYNALRDPIQPLYLGWMGGLPTRYEGALLGNLLEIHSSTANFRSFTSDSDLHCILNREELFWMGTKGVGLRDWLDQVGRGNDVFNVYPDRFPLWFTPPGG